MEYSSAANKVLVDLAYRAHSTKLYSEFLKKEDEWARLTLAARARTLNSPDELKLDNSGTRRQYLNSLADALLRFIPPEFSELGLKKAQEEAKYYGLPKVNGKYPVLASH